MRHWPANWLKRHRHPASKVLHAIGVPLAMGGAVWAVMCLIASRSEPWWCPVSLLVLGYFLQWMGHQIEGNEMGEVVVIKKCLGMPYVAISPRYACDDKSDTSVTNASHSLEHG